MRIPCLIHISCLQNRAVHMTCNLHKFDHISYCRANLGWLPFSLFVQYRSLLTMFHKYYSDKGIALRPPILLGRQHSYGTRYLQHFAAVSLCKRSFTKRFFHSQAAMWWNSLPLTLLDVV